MVVETIDGVMSLAISAGGAAIAGVWALMASIRKQFDVSRAESEARAQRTHTRIDNLREHMDENFVGKSVCGAEMGRVRDALEERDRQIGDVAGRLNCPGARSAQGGNDD